ncbi:MAG: hypothetical protein WCT52_05360 [Candidatus Micrarchaeia archaeon]
MIMPKTPISLLNSQEFQKAMSDQKAFGELLTSIFKGDPQDNAKYVERAGRIQKLVSEYLPNFTGIKKEIVIEAMREVMYKSWEMSQLTGKTPDRTKAIFSLTESLTPEQAALQEKFAGILKSKNIVALFEGKMAKHAENHVEFLAYLLVKQADFLKKEGFSLNDSDYERLAKNMCTGISSLAIRLKETKNVRESVKNANQDMLAMNLKWSSNKEKDAKTTIFASNEKTQPGKLSAEEIAKGQSLSGSIFGSKEVQEAFKSAAPLLYACTVTYWEYSSQAVDGLAKNIFASAVDQSNSPAGQAATDNIFWATVYVQDKETDERDREIAKKHGKKTGKGGSGQGKTA